MAAVAPIRLADYTPWAFNLPAIELNVDVQSNHVVVSSRLELKPQSAGAPLTSAGCRSHD
jgi:aminopeptidase N